MTSPPGDVLSGDVQETNFEPDASLATTPQRDAESPDQHPGTHNGAAHGASRGPPAANAKSPRALAPDLLRGLLMVLMAADHTNVTLGIWGHGTGGGEGEVDGGAVDGWAAPLPYALRTLTHLCAPGFTFLLGMGVAYFGASRAKLGWPGRRMAWHFFVRAAVLLLVEEVISLAASGGETWLLNIVLFALAVDYFLAGMMWLALRKSETALAKVVLRFVPEAPEDEVFEPLLSGPGVEVRRSSNRAIERAADISWYIHNAVLTALGLVTIWWNIWLSPTGGRCEVRQRSVVDVASVPSNTFLRIWFWTVQSRRVMSMYPPMAWISFAIFGLLYGRILLARAWRPVWLTFHTLLVSTAFAVLFVLTRLFQFGNLSTDCLLTPDQRAGGNPYLASPEAFFYIVKYPPDVAYFAYTMAGNLVILALLGAIPPRLSKYFTILLTYGTSALFFYTVHLLVLFALSAIGRGIYGHGAEAAFKDNVGLFFGVWFSTLLVMYPLCRYYGGFKQKTGPDSIWRFF
jgi:hypothetical protein